MCVFFFLLIYKVLVFQTETEISKKHKKKQKKKQTTLVLEKKKQS